MKGLGKIVLTVALVAIIVLSIVVASVAWFTSNPEVDANDVTLDAARTLNVEFDPNVEGSTFRYNGQIGNVAAGEDAPYVYEAGGFTLNVTSLSSDRHFGRVKVEFGEVTVVTQGSGTIPNILISDLFSIEVNAYRQNAGGEFVKDPTKNYFRARNAETDSGLARYAKVFEDLTVADDGILMTTTINPSTLEEEETMALFGEGRYELAFTYTFLPESELAKWTAGNYLSIEGYERAAGGAYVGVVNYTAYKAKYHYGMQRYSESGGVYTPSDSGNYVRAITSYAAYASVTKYDSGHNIDNVNGEYIKLGASNDYVRFDRYNMINGFPYSDDHYRGEKFTFTVGCSVEEVNNEA